MHFMGAIGVLGAMGRRRLTFLGSSGFSANGYQHDNGHLDDR
jgi:hypothetical protein